METSLDQATAVFPEPWDAPVDDGPVYTFDPMHAPYVVSPLQSSFAREICDFGFTTGLRELGLTGAAHQTTYRNHYQYDRVVIPPPASEEEAQRVGATVEANLTREVRRLKERWETEHLPTINDVLARQRALHPERSRGSRCGRCSRRWSRFSANCGRSTSGSRRPW